MQTPELEHCGFTKHGNQCMIILSSLVKDLPLELEYSTNYKRFFSIQSEPSLHFAVVKMNLANDFRSSDELGRYHNTSL